MVPLISSIGSISVPVVSVPVITVSVPVISVSVDISHDMVSLPCICDCPPNILSNSKGYIVLSTKNVVNPNHTNIIIKRNALTPMFFLCGGIVT
jgi:hypothetical protein